MAEVDVQSNSLWKKKRKKILFAGLFSRKKNKKIKEQPTPEASKEICDGNIVVIPERPGINTAQTQQHTPDDHVIVIGKRHDVTNSNADVVRPPRPSKLRAAAENSDHLPAGFIQPEYVTSCGVEPETSPAVRRDSVSSGRTPPFGSAESVTSVVGRSVGPPMARACSRSSSRSSGFDEVSSSVTENSCCNGGLSVVVGPAAETGSGAADVDDNRSTGTLADRTISDDAAAADCNVENSNDEVDSSRGMGSSADVDSLDTVHLVNHDDDTADDDDDDVEMSADRRLTADEHTPSTDELDRSAASTADESVRTKVHDESSTVASVTSSPPRPPPPEQQQQQQLADNERPDGENRPSIVLTSSDDVIKVPVNAQPSAGEQAATTAVRTKDAQTGRGNVGPTDDKAAMIAKQIEAFTSKFSSMAAKAKSTVGSTSALSRASSNSINEVGLASDRSERTGQRSTGVTSKVTLNSAYRTMLAASSASSASRARMTASQDRLNYISPSTLEPMRQIQNRWSSAAAAARAPKLTSSGGSASPSLRSLSPLVLDPTEENSLVDGLLVSPTSTSLSSAAERSGLDVDATSSVSPRFDDVPDDRVRSRSTTRSSASSLSSSRLDDLRPSPTGSDGGVGRTSRDQGFGARQPVVPRVDTTSGHFDGSAAFRARSLLADVSDDSDAVASGLSAEATFERPCGDAEAESDNVEQELEQEEEKEEGKGDDVREAFFFGFSNLVSSSSSPSTRPVPRLHVTNHVTNDIRKYGSADGIDARRLTSARPAVADSRRSTSVETSTYMSELQKKRDARKESVLGRTSSTGTARPGVAAAAADSSSSSRGLLTTSTSLRRTRDASDFSSSDRLYPGNSRTVASTREATRAPSPSSQASRNDDYFTSTTACSTSCLADRGGLRSTAFGPGPSDVLRGRTADLQTSANYQAASTAGSTASFSDDWQFRRSRVDSTEPLTPEVFLASEDDRSSTSSRGHGIPNGVAGSAAAAARTSTPFSGRYRSSDQVSVEPSTPEVFAVPSTPRTAGFQPTTASKSADVVGASSSYRRCRPFSSVSRDPATASGLLNSNQPRLVSSSADAQRQPVLRRRSMLDYSADLKSTLAGWQSRLQSDGSPGGSALRTTRQPMTSRTPVRALPLDHVTNGRLDVITETKSPKEDSPGCRDGDVDEKSPRSNRPPSGPRGNDAGHLANANDNSNHQTTPVTRRFDYLKTAQQQQQQQTSDADETPNASLTTTTTSWGLRRPLLRRSDSMPVGGVVDADRIRKALQRNDIPRVAMARFNDDGTPKSILKKATDRSNSAVADCRNGIVDSDAEPVDIWGDEYR